jgi:hypothetical protein
MPVFLFVETLPTVEEVEEIVTKILSEGLDLDSIAERLPHSWFGNEAIRDSVGEVFGRLTDPMIEQVEETVRQALSEGNPLAIVDTDDSGNRQVRPLDLESISERFPPSWFGNEAIRDSVGGVFETLAQDTLRGGKSGLRGTHPHPSPNDIREVLSTFNGRTFENLVEWFGHRLLNAADLLALLRVAAYQDPAVKGELWYARFPSADGNTRALEQDLAVNQRRRAESRLQANLPAERTVQEPPRPTSSNPTRSSPPPPPSPSDSHLSRPPDTPTSPPPGLPANPPTHRANYPCEGTVQWYQPEGEEMRA